VLVHGSFWEVLEVSSDVVVMRPWLRADIEIRRTEAATVEFEKFRGPFTYMTTVAFKSPDGLRIGKLFVTLHTRRLRSCLEELGWPVSDSRRRGLNRYM
jgi:hypothetical protein